MAKQKTDKEIEEMLKNEKIIEHDFSTEMESSYLTYSLCTIIDRALPSVSDGLKPVQRRILYSMYNQNILPNGNFKKSARIVGDVIGKYHPHGDSGCYGAMVNMANDFSTRYPLVWGHGNFGSADGDSPAAMRYTEAKLQKMAMENLKDIDNDGVQMVPNFSEDEMEPEVLPSLLPNLLLNGCDGIATGYTTCIPSHNLNEVCDGIIATINNPSITIEELVNNYIKGPDLPSGGCLIQDENILNLYLNGTGKINFRGHITTDINEENGNRQIVIDSLPPDLKKPNYVEKLYDKYVSNKEKKVVDVRDESEGNGVRIVLELHKTAIPELLIQDIYNNTALSKSKSYIFRAIVDQTPMLLNLKQLIEYYIEHRRSVVERRTKFKREKIVNKLNILEGFTKIINSLEDVAILIARSDSPKDAISKLINQYDLNQKQAESILDRKLSSLTRMEKDKILKDIKSLEKELKKYDKILNNSKDLDKEIIEELEYLKKTYGDDRKTQLLTLEEQEEVVQQTVVSDEPMFIALTNKNNIKTMPYETFTEKMKNKTFKEKSDIFIQGLKCNMNDEFILIFDNGNYLKCSFADLSMNLSKDKIIGIVPFDKDNEKVVILMSKNGMIKKIKVNAFKAKNMKITPVIPLEKDDNLIGIRITDDNDTNVITLATQNGILHRFYLRSFGSTSQTAKPLGCINLSEDDNIIDFDITDIENDKDMLVMIYSKHDSGNTSIKTMKLEEFAPKNRMAKGVKSISYYKKDNGKVSNIILTNEDDILVLDNGNIKLNKISELEVTDRASKPKVIDYNIITSKFIL